MHLNKFKCFSLLVTWTTGEHLSLTFKPVFSLSDSNFNQPWLTSISCEFPVYTSQSLHVQILSEGVLYGERRSWSILLLWNEIKDRAAINRVFASVQSEHGSYCLCTVINMLYNPLCICPRTDSFVLGFYFSLNDEIRIHTCGIIATENWGFIITDVMGKPEFNGTAFQY